ncbi:hypothetical protein ACFP4H_05530 [Pseudophaeobacter arcticus]|uniref:hypothetical protein n=1 Tax=Pseudophaeobacter arcticus TaxID=385492 RepID=UPI0003F71202|nr:hypothetical protein [Pseudophaeobacter arcticus]
MFRKLFEAFFGEAKSVDVSAWDEQGRGSKALCYIRTAQRKKLASGALALARTKTSPTFPIGWTNTMLK